MPTPVRDNGAPGPTRRLIVFVHGFLSSARTWKPLRDLLEQDPGITAGFDLRFIGYESRLTALPVFRRLPSIDEAGRSLAADLKATLIEDDGSDRYIDVTLVGHSMGGLIIQDCILSLLTPDGDGRVLSKIRQVVLFATPNFGSTTLGLVRRVLFSLFLVNPQERALRLFSQESVQLHEAIRDRVIFARRRARDEYPIPFYCFSGRTDPIVGPESAIGHFAAGEPLPGNHFQLHCPKTREDVAYRQFTSALRYPHGHQNIWEVDHFLMSVRVSPAPPGSEVLAHHGTKLRTVVYDNVGTIVRQVQFSRNNRCREPYVLKYGTRNGGWIDPQISEPHITPSDKLRLYDDNGFDAYYEVQPVPGSTARLELTVYKGFDAGNQDYHMHLGRSSVFRRITFVVDLSDYTRDGWRIDSPRLYLYPSDPGDHALCGQRKVTHVEPPTSVDTAGIWTWEVEYVNEGVVDIVWEVQPAAGRISPPTIALAPGEHALFGYGSLLSIASLERTLGRQYTGPFQVCTLEGWRRRWNVTMPNDVFVYREGGQWITPQRIVYLNVEPAAGAALNGVVFVVNSAELERFDAREWIYDRIEIGAALRGVTVTGGPAWVYGGKAAHLLSEPTSPRAGAIRQSYLAILEAGHQTLGADFARTYEATTDPLPRGLVIDDRRRDDL